MAPPPLSWARRPQRIGDSFRGGTAQGPMALGAEVDAKTQFVELLERVAAKRREIFTLLTRERTKRLLEEE